MKKKRMTNRERRVKHFIRHMKETYKNKICAIAIIALGMVPIIIEGDATATVLLWMFAIPMFFARKSWIY